MDEDRLEPDPPDLVPIDTEAVRWRVRRIATILGVGIPVALVTIAIVTGASLESTIWIGIMGSVLGFVVMVGISPQSFSLFPPGRRDRASRRARRWRWPRG